MSDAFRLLQVVRELRINPFAAVIFLALLAAYVEQRLRRRHTANFTTLHQDIVEQTRKAKSRR